MKQKKELVLQNERKVKMKRKEIEIQQSQKGYKKRAGFTRLVKHFRSDSDSPESPKAQSGSQSSQTKYRSCAAHSYGFTLAETMIVLVILGIVASIVAGIINIIF